MPNRIIKESICTSEDIARLSPQAEILFYRLIVRVDDYGLYFGNENIIKSMCYPLKSDDIKDEDIKAWVNELLEADLLFFYKSNDGKKYLKLTKWEKHQQIRAKKSKFPMPKADDCNGYHLIADDCYSPRNPIQSNPNPIQSESNKISLSSELCSDGDKVLEKPKKEKRQYEHTNNYYKSAKWLATQIENRIDGYKPHSEQILQSWADSARLMFEKDKRDVDTANKLLVFSQQDEFWSKNILSMPTFRQKYDTLLAKMSFVPKTQNTQVVTAQNTGYKKVVDILAERGLS